MERDAIAVVMGLIVFSRVRCHRRASLDVQEMRESSLMDEEEGRLVVATRRRFCKALLLLSGLI